MPSYRLIAKAARATARLFGRVLFSGWALLIPLYLVQVGSSQFFEYCAEYLRESGREDVMFIVLVSALELLVTLLWSAAWLLAIASIAEGVGRTRRPSFSQAFFGSFNALMIEQVRSLAAILWRVPLLLVPAVVQYVRLTLVPLVVILDPAYERGEIDALQQSRRLSRGHFWLLTLFVVVSLALPELAESYAQGSRGPWVWQNPLGVVSGWLITLIMNVAATLFLVCLCRALYVESPAPPHDGGDDSTPAPTALPS